MLTNDIPAPFLHAAESVTSDENWLGSLLYTYSPNAKTVINLRLGVGVTDLFSNGVSGNGSAPDPNLDTSQWPFDPLILSNNEKTTNQIPPVIHPGTNSYNWYTHVGGAEFDSFITQSTNGTVSVSRLIGRHALKAGYEQYFTRFTEQGGDKTGAAWANPGGGSNQYWNQNDGLSRQPPGRIHDGLLQLLPMGQLEHHPLRLESGRLHHGRLEGEHQADRADRPALGSRWRAPGTPRPGQHHV